MKRKDAPSSTSSDDILKRSKDKNDAVVDDNGNDKPYDTGAGAYLYIGKIDCPVPIDREDNMDKIKDHSSELHISIHGNKEKSLTPKMILDTVTVKDLLEHTPRSSFKGLIVLNSNDTIGEALNILGENHILSAPVWCEDEDGFTQLDILDITAHLFRSITRTSFSDYKHQFFDTPIIKVCNLSHRNRIKPVKLDESIGKLFISFTTVARRAVVFDDTKVGKDRAVNIVSQFDILRFLVRHKRAFRPYWSDVVAKDVMHSPPFLVPDTIRVSEVIKQLHQRKYSGAGVVSITGPSGTKLITNISVSDLRSINKDTFEGLWTDNVYEFLIKNSDGKLRFPIVAFETDDLWNVMHDMYIHHVHRIYVCDRFLHPIGIISITDVLSNVLSHVIAKAG